MYRKVRARQVTKAVHFYKISGYGIMFILLSLKCRYDYSAHQKQLNKYRKRKFLTSNSCFLSPFSSNVYWEERKTLIFQMGAIQ